VSLAWTTPAGEGATAPPPGVIPAGLAFDAECRLYHTVPEAGRVEKVRWAARDPLDPDAGDAAPTPLFDAPARAPLGDFAAAAARALDRPVGIAVDVDDRLFVAESGADRVLVFDLWSRRLLRRVALPGERPTSLSALGTTVFAALAGTRRVVRLSARGGPVPVPLPAACDRPDRVSACPETGALAVVSRAGTLDATVHVLDAAFRALDAFDEPFATDAAWESARVLVVARGPGDDFTRRRIDASGVERLPPLRARGYDGRGVVRTPERGADGEGYRIGYWTARGPRRAVQARLTFVPNGRVVTYQLDAGEHQTVWGRVFLDACIPEGTEVRVRAVTTDDDPDEDAALLPRTPPANVEHVTVLRPDLSPPMPPLELLPNEEDPAQRLHRRESGRELPWAQPPADDPFRTYEAPIIAPAGRWLWLALELRGTTHVTPRVRCVRAEHPSHDYLRRIPRLFSRDEADASFLLRYLAITEGFLGETEARAADRHVLLNPRATPAAALPWLASFVGLVLDERWARAPRPGGGTVDARRAVVAEAAWLLRFRGTVRGLKRFIELYAGVDVVILERFRLRGLGGGVLGTASAVLGGGFRVGGAVGTQRSDPSRVRSVPRASASGDRVEVGGPPPSTEDPVADAYATHAHRFTVLIPASLTEEQLAVVRDILDVHRPAHTLVDVCTVGAGMRAGRGLHVALSSIVGPTGGFGTIQLGAGALGRNAVVGRPSGGTTVEASRLGADARVR
jgi:phage tail-like protein